MNTPRTIPWDAVVEGAPRPPRGRTLPLAISKSFQKRAGRTGGGDVSSLATLVDAVTEQALSADALALVSRGPSSSLIELVLGDGTIVVLTGGGRSATLQTHYHPQASRQSSPELWRDALLCTHVARHARLDPDERAFVIGDTDVVEEDMRRSPRFEFSRPANWGFIPNPRGGHRWTAPNFFKSAKPRDPSRPSDLTRPRFRDIFEDPTADPATATPAADSQRGDPFQCLPQLRQIRSICDRPVPANTANEQSDRLAWDLALALGRCRLFGITPPPADDFTLKPFALYLALKELARFVDRINDLASNLEHEIDRQGGHRAQTLALELLEARMDVWCVYLAIDEAYAAARYDGAPGHTYLGKMVQAANDQIENFDANLERKTPLLTPAAGTLLLTNWRRLLAPAYRQILPWWLDGSLEASVPA